MLKVVLIDFLLLIRCFTFSRFINLIKLELSRWMNVLFDQSNIWGTPYAISIEPVNKCNLHCLECPSGRGELKRSQGLMPLDLYMNIIDKVSKKSFYLNLYFQGEPMMHPDFIEMIAYAKSKRMFVFTSTNGHFLTEKSAKQMIDSKLDKLIISFDGYNQDSYEKYRVGGKFEKVTQGIKNIAQAKKETKSKSPLLIAQVLVLKTTENHLDEIKSLALSIGADKVEYKKAQFYNPNKEGTLLPLNPRYLRYQFTEMNGWVLKTNKKKRCARLWKTTVISWQGDVLPCCYDKDANYCYGNIKHQELKDIIDNPKAKIFRKNVSKSRSNYDICSNCGE